MDMDALKNPSPNLLQNLVDLSFVVINNIFIGIYQINWLRLRTLWYGNIVWTDVRRVSSSERGNT
jgi:hypothetical protein